MKPPLPIQKKLNAKKQRPLRLAKQSSANLCVLRDFALNSEFIA